MYSSILLDTISVGLLLAALLHALLIQC